MIQVLADDIKLRSVSVMINSNATAVPVSVQQTEVRTPPAAEKCELLLCCGVAMATAPHNTGCRLQALASVSVEL